MFSTLDELQKYSLDNPSKLIILKFEAKWCAPCKAIKPFIDYLINEYPNVEFHIVDIEDDDTHALTESIDIAKVPTFIYYKNGNVCSTIIGTNKENIENTLNDNL